MAAPTTISLMFHDVTDRPDESGFRQPAAARYKHTRKQFQQYLEVLAELQLPVVTTAQLSDAVGAASVVFTFDDGGASAPIAADMLEEFGCRGIFFVTTDLIGTRGFMTPQQICDLHSRGHVIGSHSCSHPDVFRSLTRDQKNAEWTRSCDVLQQLLGAETDTASVPGGDCDAATFEVAAAAGIRHLFTSEQQTKPWQQAGITCYGRLMMLSSTTPETLRRWLKHPTVGILPEQLVRMTKSGVKQLMGPVYLRLMRRRRASHEQSR